MVPIPQYVSATAADGSGNVYVAGTFRGTVNMGAFTLTSVGGEKACVATALAVSSSRVYLVCNFFSSSFNSGSMTLANTGTNGSPDVFATRLTDLGPSPRYDWVQRVGVIFNDQAQPATLSDTTLYVGGFVSTLAYFGAIPFTYPVAGLVPFLAGPDDSAVLATAAATALPGFSLAPNPAHTSSTVRLPAVPVATHATLCLLDALGRTVRPSCRSVRRAS
jgi:hypothetical protein